MDYAQFQAEASKYAMVVVEYVNGMVKVESYHYTAPGTLVTGNGKTMKHMGGYNVLSHPKTSITKDMPRFKCGRGNVFSRVN